MPDKRKCLKNFTPLHGHTAGQRLLTQHDDIQNQAQASMLCHAPSWLLAHWALLQALVLPTDHSLKHHHDGKLADEEVVVFSLFSWQVMLIPTGLPMQPYAEAASGQMVSLLMDQSRASLQRPEQKPAPGARGVSV